MTKCCALYLDQSLNSKVGFQNDSIFLSIWSWSFHILQHLWHTPIQAHVTPTCSRCLKWLHKWVLSWFWLANSLESTTHTSVSHQSSENGGTNDNSWKYHGQGIERNPWCSQNDPGLRSICMQIEITGFVGIQEFFCRSDFTSKCWVLLPWMLAIH